MKSFIAIVLFILSVSTTQADVRGMSVTADGASFPLGLDADNTPNWDTIVGEVNADTGVDTHETGFDSCKTTVNGGDTTKIDIAGPCNVHIQGPHYVFDGVTSLDPSFAVGENSRFIGVTMAGYTSQTSDWTDIQKRTIIPLARLNTPLGQLGSGSDVHLVRDDRYYLTGNFYFDRLYHEEAIGALYVRGGDIFSNSTSGLILGQNEGVLWDGQKKRHTLETFQNQSAVFIHLSSSGGNDWIAAKIPLAVDAVNFNPSGSGLIPMQNDNTFTVHTILKSPKGQNGTQEGGLFFIYGTTEYGTAAAALAAITSGAEEARFAVFENQSRSALVPVALIIQQKNATSVDTIVDRRPCLVCRP